LALQLVRNAAYKLQLPPASRIHPFVHVSQLKKYKGLKPTEAVSSTLRIALIRRHQVLQPKPVVGERMIGRGSKMVPQIKVQWQGMPTSCNSWEPFYDIVNAYPSSPAVGLADLPRRGDLSYEEGYPGEDTYRGTPSHSRGPCVCKAQGSRYLRRPYRPGKAPCHVITIP
jgi:hypothetical protein